MKEKHVQTGQPLADSLRSTGADASVQAVSGSDDLNGAQRLNDLNERERQRAILLAMIGEPYEEPDGCMRFLKRALAVLGVEIEGTAAAMDHDRRLFNQVDSGELGTVIMWDSLVVCDNEYKFHVGLMLDQRWALQSSPATNGVGRVEITRAPWSLAGKYFYRPKVLCS